MDPLQDLEKIIEQIRADLTRKNTLRDTTLARSRELIRFCANSIRATHRHEFEQAITLLSQAQAAAKVMCDDARPYADIYYSGYTQDAMKELAEASITLALVSRKALPDPDFLGVEYPAYLNGLGEAMGEMRRFALDSMRREDIEDAERMMAIMDDVYTFLVTIDFPDALTGNLRRTTDMVRGVTEKTRGDLTTVIRQERLQQALQAFEERWKDRIDRQ